MIVIAASYLLAWWIKFEGPFADTGAGAYTMEFYFKALYFIVPGYLIIYYMNKMYTPKRTQKIETVVTQIFGANVVGAVAFLVCIALFKIGDFSRGLIGIYSVINVILMVLERLIVRGVLRKIRSRGYNVKHILLVGYSRAAEEYINVKALEQGHIGAYAETGGGGVAACAVGVVFVQASAEGEILACGSGDARKPVVLGRVEFNFALGDADLALLDLYVVLKGVVYAFRE